MSGRDGSGSTWGHVESVRLRSASSEVGVDVGTPFKSSGRQSLPVTASFSFLFRSSSSSNSTSSSHPPPFLLFSSVTDIPLLASVLTVGVVCLAYTAYDSLFLLLSLSILLPFLLFLIFLLFLLLSSVTGIPLPASVLTVGVVCLAYTAFGGLKGVIWADVFQSLVLFAGLLLLLLLGVARHGGWSHVWLVGRLVG